jgi:protein-tyrosine-phosphatase
VADHPSPPARSPGAVLFACNYNRVRSPIAAALLRRLVGDRTFVDSCGLKRPPQGVERGGAYVVDPLAAEVMAEIGMDIA